MKKLSIILLLFLFLSCHKKTNESIILETIHLGLAEFLNKDSIVLINSGSLEDGYFLKKLKKVKGDTLRNNPKLNGELMSQLLQSEDSSFFVDLSNLKSMDNLNFSHSESEIDSLLNANSLVYKLGYSVPQANDYQVLYYIELIDPTHRIRGKGVLVQLIKQNNQWEVESIVNGWEMRYDTILFFSKFQ